MRYKEPKPFPLAFRCETVTSEQDLVKSGGYVNLGWLYLVSTAQVHSQVLSAENRIGWLPKTSLIVGGQNTIYRPSPLYMYR